MIEGFTSEELMKLRIDYKKKEREEFIDLWDEFISIVTDEKLAENDCFLLRWFITPFIICIEISGD